MIVMTTLKFRNLPFEEAARQWLEIKKMHTKKARTIEMYEWYIRNLRKVFDGVLMSQIHIGHFLEYQRQRRMEAGPSCVNYELNTMVQILKSHDVWDLNERNYNMIMMLK